MIWQISTKNVEKIWFLNSLDLGARSSVKLDNTHVSSSIERRRKGVGSFNPPPLEPFLLELFTPLPPYIPCILLEFIPLEPL